jgi:hypothetical protein
LPLLHLGSIGVPCLKERLGLFHGHTPVFGQTVRCLPVSDTEVQRLCFATLAAVLVLRPLNKREEGVVEKKDERLQQSARNSPRGLNE